jgi:hypothetical protein
MKYKGKKAENIENISRNNFIKIQQLKKLIKFFIALPPHA